MPDKIFRKVNKQFKVRKTNCILQGFEGTVVKPIGTVNLLCKYKEMYEDFVIAQEANQVLLSGVASITLGLIKRINSADQNKEIFKESEGKNEKLEFIKANRDIFNGFGRFSKEYKIVTK